MTQVIQIHRSTRCVAISALICVSMVVAGQCPAKAAEQQLKVGFLCVGPISDNGFNQAHEQGRQYLEKHSGGKVKTTLAEKVPESAVAERVMEKMIAQGNKLIFTTSYGFMEPVERVAKRHSDVVFMQINRFGNTKNIGTYFSHQYQPMYLAGMVAGKLTKKNKLGFIAAHPVPPLVQAINAFTLGARATNPKVTTRVVFINNWSDAPLESEAVKSLHEAGCDVVAHAQDNQNTIMPACESAGIYSVGFYTDASKLAPKGWLTGACLDWGPFYTKIADLVRAGKWTSKAYSDGMEGKEGYIKLASFGKAVPKPVQQEVSTKENLLREGKFVVFAGPMKDRDGQEKIPAGKKLSIKELGEMNWFVSGVVGALPKNK